MAFSFTTSLYSSFFFFPNRSGRLAVKDRVHRPAAFLQSLTKTTAAAPALRMLGAPTLKSPSALSQKLIDRKNLSLIDSAMRLVLLPDPMAAIQSLPPVFNVAGRRLSASLPAIHPIGIYAPITSNAANQIGDGSEMMLIMPPIRNKALTPNAIFIL
jgi:hypothetical protein